jgi:hypothetical protein
MLLYPLAFVGGAGNPNRMRDLDAEGQKRHWIFEIHFVDRSRQIGGFCEQLLTID